MAPNSGRDLKADCYAGVSSPAAPSKGLTSRASLNLPLALAMGRFRTAGVEDIVHRIARGAPSISVGRASALEATLSELAGGG